MIRGFAILLALGLGIFQFHRWSRRVGPQQTTRALRQAGLILLGLVALLLLARGGLAALLPLLLPLLIPYWQHARQSRADHESRASQNHSTVRTRYLEMHLDHDTGRMSGRVIAGQFAGQRLDDLGLETCITLYREVVRDSQSQAVLEAYLDRTHGEHWRDFIHQDGQGQSQDDLFADDSILDRRRALEILGLEEGASVDEIRQAHRRLMQKFHPDHGGSAFLAAQINRAKDLLLGK